MVSLKKAEIVLEEGREYVKEGSSYYAKSQWTEHPEWFLGEPCHECGFENPNVHYSEPMMSLLKESKLCHTCHFWTGKVASMGNDTTMTRFVAGGNMYSFYTNEPWSDARGALLGHGGREFWVYFPSIDVFVKTNNLWHQGTVPAHFRTRLPDNAEFINGPRGQDFSAIQAKRKQSL